MIDKLLIDKQREHIQKQMSDMIWEEESLKLIKKLI